MSVRLRILRLYETQKAAHFVILGIVAAGSMATAQTPANTQSAVDSYKANCTICHADDGSGTALGKRLHVKDLRSSEVQEKPSTALTETIRKGKDNMPAFATRLDDEQIQKLVEYIRHIASVQH